MGWLNAWTIAEAKLSLRRQKQDKYPQTQSVPHQKLQRCAETIFHLMDIAQTQIFCDRSCADNGQQGQQQYKQRVDVEGHGGR